MGAFLRPGKGRWYFLPSIASATKAPTVAEIAAGTHLTDPNAVNQLIGVEGFDSETTFVTIEPYSTLQTLKLAGRQNSNDSSMTFTEDDSGNNPARTTLARDVDGFIVEAPIGVITAGTKVDVFPVTVGSNNRQRNGANEAASFQVTFSVTGIPAQDVAILA